jgi:GST-like protein
MIDEDGPNGSPITLSQSGLIMLYAADKAERFLPQDKAERLIAMQWFMAAISDVAPANAIIKYFGQNAPDRSEGNQRYLEGRLLALLEAFEGQIGEKAFILDEVSVADLALFPVIHLRGQLLATSDRFPVLLRWYDRMLRRDAIQRAIRSTR